MTVIRDYTLPAGRGTACVARKVSLCHACKEQIHLDDTIQVETLNNRKEAWHSGCWDLCVEHAFEQKTKAIIDINIIVSSVTDELHRAKQKFPKGFHNAHEGYAVLLEEVDEVWDAIKTNNISHAKKEMIQVAAMALRFLMEV